MESWFDPDIKHLFLPGWQLVAGQLHNFPRIPHDEYGPEDPKQVRQLEGLQCFKVQELFFNFKK